MLPEIDLVAFLAVWGAILSSIAFGWNLYRDLTDRGKLRVHCFIGKIADSASPRKPEELDDYLVYSVTNVGKRPILLKHIGGIEKKNNFIILPHNPLPKMLLPGEYFLDYTEELDILDEDLRHLIAVDSLGRNHKVPRRQVRKLKREYKKKQLAKAEKGFSDDFMEHRDQPTEQQRRERLFE